MICYDDNCRGICSACARAYRDSCRLDLLHSKVVYASENVPLSTEEKSELVTLYQSKGISPCVKAFKRSARTLLGYFADISPRGTGLVESIAFIEGCDFKRLRSKWSRTNVICSEYEEYPAEFARSKCSDALWLALFDEVEGRQEWLTSLCSLRTKMGCNPDEKAGSDGR